MNEADIKSMLKSAVSDLTEQVVEPYGTRNKWPEETEGVASPELLIAAYERIEKREANIADLVRAAQKMIGALDNEIAWSMGRRTGKLGSEIAKALNSKP